MFDWLTSSYCSSLGSVFSMPVGPSRAEKFVLRKEPVDFDTTSGISKEEEDAFFSPRDWFEPVEE